MGGNSNDPFSSLTRMWLDMAANAMQAWQPLAGGTASPEMFRKGRADFMQVWSDWCDELMRSSAFLEAQKNSLDGSLAFRKLIRTNLRRTQRDLQLAGREDVDALAAAIRRSQRRVLDQLEENAERLQSLEAKLDRLGQQMERIVGAQHGAENGAADASADAAGKHNGGKKKKRHKDKDRPATAGS